MEIYGSISHTVFEKDNFSIRTFKALEQISLPNGHQVKTITIKGNFIPSSLLDLKLEGEFDAKPYTNKNGKKSYTFNVTNYEELKLPEKDNIIKYLESIQGIGPRLAKRIYKKFGDETFTILDEDIENLKQVRGIGKKKFEIISSDYLSRGAAKELYLYLNQFHIPNNKIEKIYRIYKADALEKAKHHPYSLYLLHIIPFETADKIAKLNEHDMLSAERIQACIIYALKKSESNGNTYFEWKDLLRDVTNILEVDVKSKDMRKKVCLFIRDNARILEGTQIMSVKRENCTLIQRKITYDAELNSEKKVKKIVNNSVTSNADYSEDIAEAENNLGIQLSDEQKQAIQTAMNSSLSIVTGGPGTGKTSFQKVLFYVFQKHYDTDITLAAPTGRAARRMTDASGLPARTLHQTLGLMAAEDEDFAFAEPIELPPGLFVVDEMSMVDIFLFEKIMEAVTTAVKTVFVGDVFQLPSVGCGAVLKDLIDSGEIPVTKFTKVFRQEEGSIIAANAAAINEGSHDLEYGKHFCFLQESDSEKIQKYALDYYRKALKVYGPDEVAVLTPFRKHTETGVNALNPILKEAFKPKPENITKYSKVNGIEAYIGDKIMYTKNLIVPDENSGSVMLSNGDIGYITDISVEDKVQIVEVDFGDGRVVKLMGDDIKHIVQAYATTVHKSQGSEYKCCIILIDPKHRILLKKNLVYTALTRAKEKVILIGDKEAFLESILCEDTVYRRTLLFHRNASTEKP